MARRGSSFPFGALLAFVALTVAAFILFQMGGAGLANAGTNPEEVTNESIEINFQNSVHVSASASRYTQGYNDSIQAYNSSGAKLEAGDDYKWNQSTGAITWYNTSETTDGNFANVSYTYYQNVQEIRQSEPGIRSLIQAVGGPIVFAPLVTFIGLVIVWFVWFVKKSLRGSGINYGGRR